MNFKKLGAALLTISMAATFVVAPAGNVNAATYDTSAQSVASSDDYITTNKTLVATYKTDDTSSAQEKFEASEYYNSSTDLDNMYKYVKDGYELDDDDEDVYYVYSVTYTNIRTKKTSTDKDDLLGANTNNYVIPSKITAYKGDYTYINLQFERGKCEISNLKSSKKKVAAVKIQSSNSSKSTGSETNRYYYDTNDNKVYFYYDSASGKYVETTSETYNSSSGSVAIRIQGKKAGKTKVTFNILDNNGTVVDKASINVVVKDVQPMKSLTFAGKDLLGTSTIGDAETKRLGSGKNSNLGYDDNTTTKKSGKLKVKMNKNFKLVALYYGVLTDATDTSTSTYSTSTYKYSSNNAGYSDVETVKADLNGDGDTLDTVNGIEEDNVTVKYTKIKNNKKIKLGKVGSYYVSSSNYTYGTSSSSYSSSQLVTSAPTYVKVVYYDKVSKQYGTYQTTIYKKINKTYK